MCPRTVGRFSIFQMPTRSELLLISDLSADNTQPPMTGPRRLSGGGERPYCRVAVNSLRHRFRCPQICWGRRRATHAASTQGGSGGSFATCTDCQLSLRVPDAGPPQAWPRARGPASGSLRGSRHRPSAMISLKIGDRLASRDLDRRIVIRNGH